MGVSLLLQVLAVGILLIVPLMHPEMLKVNLTLPVWVPLKPVTAQPPPLVRSVPQSARSAAPRLFALVAPTRVPRTISMETDAPLFSGPVTAGTETSFGNSAGLSGLTDVLPSYVPPPLPPPAVKKPEPPKAPIHVGGGVQAAQLIFGPKPLYPPLARAARQQGTVRLQAVIAKDGSIQRLAVVSGPPLLIAAALEAVKQWRYRPTRLNGEAVEVATEIDVNFILGQ